MKSIKFKFIEVTMLLFSAISIFSQNNWTINGNGNTIGSTNFLGTTNNEPLNFRTNNTQRMNLRELNNLNPIWYPGGNNAGYLALGDPVSADL